MAVDLGKLGDKLVGLNEEIEQQTEVLKGLEKKKRDLEDQLLQAMGDAGTDVCRGTLATISISETVSARIEDWAKFEQYVYRHKLLHLMYKRISSTAYREVKERLGNKPVPGLADFKSQRLNVTKVNRHG